jgi:protein-tyrosine phosphatase
LIDLHFHCLPGIDDGPSGWREAVALCRAAAAEGTHTIVATPHVLRDPWINDDVAKRNDLIRELNDRLEGTPLVLPGCEYYFSNDAVELWELGSAGPLTGLNGSNYLLMEFPATRIPANAESVVHELSLIGVTSVIAHPERNLVFSNEPEKLQRLLKLGAIAQITAASLLGEFGRPTQIICDDFFRRGLVHVAASDAHSVEQRPPLLDRARERVRKSWGIDAADALFESNPRSIVNGDALEQS